MGVIGAVLFLGIIYYIVAPEGGGGGAALPNPQELESVKQMANQTAHKDMLSDIEMHRLLSAETPWKRNPFFNRVLDARGKVEEKKEELKSAESLKLAFTGYVDIDARRYAIINGLEYEVGEEIEDARGVFLTSIQENQVILGQRNATSEIVDQFLLPLTDDPVEVYNN